MLSAANGQATTRIPRPPVTVDTRTRRRVGMRSVGQTRASNVPAWGTIADCVGACPDRR